MPSATVTSKGQITIPVEVRTKLGLTSGVKVDFWETAAGDFLIRPRTGSIKDMYGILRRLGYVPEGSPLTIEEMDEAIAEHVAELDDATRSDAAPKNNEEAA